MASPVRRPGSGCAPGKGGDERLTDEALYWFWLRPTTWSGSWPMRGFTTCAHSHASHAVMNGASLHVAGRLLGASQSHHDKPLLPF